MHKLHFKRFLAILLATITVLASLTMFGCSQKGGADDFTSDSVGPETSSDITSDTGAETTADSSSETTGEQGPNLPYGTLFDEKKTDYTIVHALYSGIASQNAVLALQKALEDNCDVVIEARKENYYNSINPGMTGRKIVVGYVEKDATAMEIYNSLTTPNSYIIKFVDNSLYIIGGSGESTADAVDYFISTYLIKYYTYTLKLEDGIIAERNAPPLLENLTISDNSIEEYVIIHDDSAVGGRRAKELAAMISEKTGVLLKVKPHTEEPVDKEILVGKTNRQESIDARADYDRPGVYYDVKVVGEKLVCMGESWYTLDKIVRVLSEHLDTMNAENSDLDGEILSGDMLDEIDTTDMLNRAEGTDVRVFNYNTYGTIYSYSSYDLFSGEVERGEVIGDIILAYFPDVITTNEFYVNSALYNAAMSRLSDYYVRIDSEYDVGYPFSGVTGNVGRGNPEQILIKKSCNFKIIDSGWRYLSEGNGNLVDFHGIHWAVLETQEGKQFIVSVGHYADSSTDPVYAREHQDAIKMAQESSGSSEILPAIAAGDFFSNATSGAAYKYHIETSKFIDPQRIKEINRNITSKGIVNINQATSHAFGKTKGDGTRIDFIFHNDKFTPLKFKVLKSTELDYTSDHYPECVDLKIN